MIVTELAYRQVQPVTMHLLGAQIEQAPMDALQKRIFKHKTLKTKQNKRISKRKQNINKNQAMLWALNETELGIKHLDAYAKSK